jgi:hypothetical protein
MIGIAIVVAMEKKLRVRSSPRRRQMASLSLSPAAECAPFT